MSYTLSDFLNDKIIPEISLLTKELDFSRIPVMSACVQELPLENLSFIQPDEIVLTTGIGADKDPRCLLELIQGAGNAHAAAIVFSLQAEPVPFPADCISYADSISLPVFLMPWKYRFSSIQSRLLAAVQEKDLAVFKTLQNRLFNAFFESASLSDAAELIASAFECRTEILDSSGHRIACSAQRSGEQECPFSSDIQIGGDHFGYLRLFPEEDNPFFPVSSENMEKYAAFPLSLWFHKRRIEDITAARLKNDFVWNLSQGNYSSFEEMVKQGHYLGFDLDRPYTCLILYTEQQGGSPVPRYSSQAARDSERTENILAETGSERKLSVMAAGQNGQYLIYLENKGAHPEERISQYMDLAEVKLHHEFPSVRCLWGISESPTQPDDFKRLYKNAALALQYCMNRKDSQTRFTYKDTKKALIISALSEKEEIMENARETLGKLMEYDQNSGMGLLHTLAEYIRCGCNTSKTARNLHIHRQSLLYRLEKIELLTGMSLSNHDDVFVLEIFSRIFASY